jgi:hypothetical protein
MKSTLIKIQMSHHRLNTLSSGITQPDGLTAISSVDFDEEL